MGGEGAVTPKPGWLDGRFDLLIMGAIAAVLGGILWYASEAPLWKCDEAIKETLKAPSTYRRISVDGPSGVYSIEYDAENSFGVPLRGHGTCLISDGKATWLDLSR